MIDCLAIYGIGVEVDTRRWGKMLKGKTLFGVVLVKNVFVYFFSKRKVKLFLWT